VFRRYRNRLSSSVPGIRGHRLASASVTHTLWIRHGEWLFSPGPNGRRVSWIYYVATFILM
jgi:hypothetical protein